MEFDYFIGAAFCNNKSAVQTGSRSHVDYMIGR